jgi:hypothetical protein
MKLGEKWKKWKTTALGVITALAMILVLTGVISPEQKQVIDETTGELAVHADVLAESIVAIIGLISGVINVFRAD